jgi:ribosomal protein L37AE/L43A
MDLTCKLYNRNSFDHKEMFQGKQIVVPANSFIMMDYDAAQQFMGQFTPVVKLKDGTTDPKFHKKLEIDKDDARRCEAALRNESEEKAEKVFVCQSCLKEFGSKKALLKHVKEKHMDSVVDEKSRDEIEDE